MNNNIYIVNITIITKTINQGDYMEERLTTLNVKESTKNKFKQRGVKGQTDDQLLNVLIETFDLHYKKEGDEQ